MIFFKSFCCGYGNNGNNANGFDCVVIPGNYLQPILLFDFITFDDFARKKEIFLHYPE